MSQEQKVKTTFSQADLGEIIRQKVADDFNISGSTNTRIDWLFNMSPDGGVASMQVNVAMTKIEEPPHDQ